MLLEKQLLSQLEAVAEILSSKIKNLPLEWGLCIKLLLLGSEPSKSQFFGH